jgi:hypothetical protein
MKATKRSIAVVLTILMLTACFSGIALAGDTQSVNINVSQDDLLDIVLTLGNTDTDATNVKADLLSALTTLGVPQNRINIQAVETNTVDPGNTSDGWEIYDHTNYNTNIIEYYRPYYEERNGNYTLYNHMDVTTAGQTNIDF